MRRFPIFFSLIVCTAASTNFLPAQTFEVDEQARTASLEEAKARREAFEKFGVVPSVPRSLSENPTDPEFVFEGYTRMATREEADEAMLHAQAPRVDDDVDDTKEPEDLGVFINAVGETWRWRPRDKNRTIEAAKSKLGLSRDAVETQAVFGAGFEDPQASDWEVSNEKLQSSIKANPIGTDSRTIRSADSGHCMTCVPWRMIGALEPDGQSANSPNAQCTATKVGPRHLLTAGHCVHTGGSGGALVERDWWSGQDGMDFYANGGDASPNGIRNIEWYWIHPDWLSSAKSNRDYAVVMLYDSSSTVGLGWFGLKVDNSLANTSAWNFGYPGWGNACANSNWANNSCRNSLWGMSATITRTTSRMAYYKHDTQGGQSGSPVYQHNGGNRQIVAVHKGGYSSLENRGVKITSYVFDTIMAVRAAWPSIYD